MESSDNTSIQLAALTQPLEGLSAPSVDIVGQEANQSSGSSPATYRNITRKDRGPYLAETQHNIDLFTEIFNSGLVLENIINGHIHENTLPGFLHAVLGVQLDLETQVACVLYDRYPNTSPFYPTDAAIPNSKPGCITNDAFNLAEELFVSPDLTLDKLKLFTNFTNSKKFLLTDGLVAKKNWYLFSDFMDTMQRSADGETGLTPLVPSDQCASSPEVDGQSGVKTFSIPRSTYKIPLSLASRVTGIAGVNLDSPPDIVSVPLPLNDANLMRIFVNPDHLQTFSPGRTIDVRVAPGSLIEGLPDLTKKLSIVNQKKFGFSSSPVTQDGEAGTILESVNLNHAIASKNFFLADTVETNVWKTGVGDWRSSQTDNPEISAKLVELGYTPEMYTGMQSLRRLNLIPVLSSDKIQVPMVIDGESTFAVDPTSQVNLLEAVWTSWKNILELNTSVYGIDHTHMPELSATALINELSGQSIIEIVNNLYNSLTTGDLSGTTIVASYSALSALPSPAEFHEGKLARVGCDLYISCDGTWTEVAPGGQGGPATVPNYTTVADLPIPLSAHEGKLATVNCELYVACDGEWTKVSFGDFTNTIETLSTQFVTVSALSWYNYVDITTLSAEVMRLSKTDTLSSLIMTFSAIDHLTLIQKLSGLTTDLSSILTLSGDFQQLLTKLDILSSGLDDRFLNLEACCDNNTRRSETNTEAITALSHRIDEISLSALSGVANLFESIDMSTYLTQLSALQQTVNEFTSLDEVRVNVQSNTTILNTTNTTLSALSGDIYNEIFNINKLLAASGTDVSELSALGTIINNIHDLTTFLQQLSTNERMTDLELCCEENRTTGTTHTTQLETLTNLITDTETLVRQLSSRVLEPTGVVLTTRHQTVSGRKTFKNTLTVNSSGHFEKTLTVGDKSSPKVFDVCSENGTTKINIKSLPTSLNINDLNTGDLYTVQLDNNTTVIAIKT